MYSIATDIFFFLIQDRLIGTSEIIPAWRLKILNLQLKIIYIITLLHSVDVYMNSGGNRIPSRPDLKLSMSGANANDMISPLQM